MQNFYFSHQFKKKKSDENRQKADDEHLIENLKNYNYLIPNFESVATDLGGKMVKQRPIC